MGDFQKQLPIRTPCAHQSETSAEFTIFLKRFGIDIGCNNGGLVVEHNNIGQDSIQSERHKYENEDFERVEPEK